MDNPEEILAIVKPCLKQWELEINNIVLVSHSENIVYKAQCANGDQYAIRVHRPGYSSLIELESEQIWLAVLKEYGIDVPVACRTSKGVFYCEVDIGGITRYIGVIEWLDGHSLHEILEQGDTPSLYNMISKLGKLIAKTHNQATSWQPPSGFLRRCWDIEGLLGDDPHWGRFWEVATVTDKQRQLMSISRQYLISQLESYDTNSDNYSMIHADLHAGNLMVTGDGNESSLVLIDFDDAGYGWHLYDLAVAISGYRGRADFAKITHTLIEGYRTVRKLKKYDAQYMAQFLLMRSLASIGWISGRPELNHDAYLSHLINLIERDAQELGIV